MNIKTWSCRLKLSIDIYKQTAKFEDLVDIAVKGITMTNTSNPINIATSIYID